MKITALLMFAVLMKVSATGYSQINLCQSNIRLQAVFKEIKKQTGLNFLYSSEVLEEAGPITLQVKNGTLQDAMEQSLKGTLLTYEIVDRTVVITKGNIADKTLSRALRAAINVGGRITDENGNPVAASVLVKGTHMGTTTDEEGYFELKGVNENAVLVVSGVNIETKEVKVGGKSSLTIVAITKIAAQTEVVVTALGVGKDRKGITYATQNISSQEITKVKDVSFLNSLSGKVAGAVITKGNFGPGSATKILMRGDKSFIGNSEPLYVIDGAPMFGGSDLLANINPEDIESIQVMKGASAAALYGSQAANGVILVTTRKGKGGGARINVSSQFTAENAVDLPELQTNYGQADVTLNDSWGPKITNGTDAHLKQFFKTGKTLVNALSLSNGNDISQIYLSYANTIAKGILPENDMTRNNFMIRGTARLFNKKLTLDGYVNYTNQKVYNQNDAGGYSSLPGIFSFPTGDDFSKYSGDNYQIWDPGRQLMVQNWPYIRNETFPDQNPYWVQKKNQNDFFRDHAITSITAKYKLADWLSVQARGVYDMILDHNEQRLYASTQATMAGPNGGYGVSDSHTKYFYSDLLLIGNRNISNNLSLSATVGASNTSTNARNLALSSTVPTSLTFPNYFSVFALNGLFNKTESLKQTLNQSVFGNATLGFREKLYLDATARQEWSSTISQSFFYPSVGLSYVPVNKQSGNLPGISFTKFRASYAEVGNSLPFGIQEWTPPYSLDNSGNINGRGTLPFFNGTDTVNLRPERTKSYEFGVDLRMLRNRLTVNLTFYHATTYDQVFQIQAPAGAGATNFWINGGTILNRGTEGIVTFKASSGRISWTPSLSFSSNKNQIRQLSDLLQADYFALGGSYREVSLFLTRPKDGHYGSYGDIFGKIYETDANGKMLLNSDGLPSVSTDFEHYVGNANPKFLAGLNNNFVYGNITASILIDGRFGGKIFNRTEQWLDYKGLSKRTGEARDKGGVLVDGKLVDAKAFYLNQTGAGAGGAVAANLYDATNVRLRELVLGYTFSKLRGVALSASVVGRNLFFLYKNAPFDPEINASTSQTSEGISSFTMPSVRSIGISINATF